MNFDDIKSVWDSQELSDTKLDHDLLWKQVHERDRSFSRLVNVTEIVMILVLLFNTAMFMRDPLLQGHDRVLIVPGLACLVAAGFVLKRRKDRKCREVNYDNSLLGLIEKSIAAIESRCSLMRNFLWWFACPMCLGLAIGLFIVDESKRYLLYGVFIPAFFVCMGLAYWQIRREIRTTLLPEKQRLEELQAKLTAAE